MIIVKGRELLIPNNERYIGTTYDDNSTVRTFRIPRFHEDGMDKSQLDFYVIINYDDGSDPDAVGVVKAVNDDYIVLEWDVGEDVTEHSGCLFLWVRGFDYTGAVRWSSFPGVFYIEGSGTEPTDLSNLEQRISEEDKLIRLAKLYKCQPMTAATAADMVNREQIYVYVGDEEGYQYGHWYFWDGSAWVSGGVYNSIGLQTDKELIAEDVAADAKVTGDNVRSLSASVRERVVKFATCVEMKASTALKSGMVCQTAGHYSVNDGGAALYYIMGAAPVDDYYETLQNGLIAILVANDSVTPEMFGAYGDGDHDDTVAFISAMATGLDVIATGTYKVGALTVENAHISGKGVGTIICDSIMIEPDAVVEELSIECSGENAFIVDTTSKPTNTTVYNSFVRHCTVTCATDGSMAFFNLLNGKGVVAVTFDDITVKCAGNGHSVFRIHTEQTAASRPWISPAMFLNIMAVEDPFQYFIYIDDPVMTGGTYSGSFFKFIIENCHFQYYSGITRYCGYLRGVKNTIININTYDFPAADPIYYFSALDSSVRLTAIPLDHGNLMTAIDGVTGYERNAFYLETALYHAGYSNFRPEVYDSYTDLGTYTPYNMPTMFPVAFTDESNSHKLNGIAIPQSKALYDGTRGSAVFANDNSNNQPVFWVYSTSGTWIKHTLMTDRNCPRGTTAERPSSVSIGYMYYDTTLHKPIWWSGLNNAWRDATGAAV